MICQRWTESEAGWGQRPDGYSLHNTRQHRDEFIKEYWDGQPDRDAGGNPPDEYSFPDGEPFTIVMDDIEVIAKLNASKNGIYYNGKVLRWD